MTRDVVPQPVEPRGFLRRRRTDDPRPVPDVMPAQAVPVPVPVAVTEPPAPAPPQVAPPRIEPPRRTESDELLRAKDALLQAALRESDRLTAENELLRDALAALHADALARQEVVQETPTVAPPLVPEQRAEPVAEPADPDVAARNARRRSERRAGPG